MDSSIALQSSEMLGEDSANYMMSANGIDINDELLGFEF